MSEPISKALERARDEGQTKLRFSKKKPSPLKTDRVSTLQSYRSTTPIAYHQSRSVKVSQAQLLARRVVAGFEQDEAAAAFNILRTRVMQKMQAEGWHTLMITSARANAGKSCIAVNLAVALARAKTHTVLLVDADLRRPSIHTYFDDTPEAGLIDLLQEGKPTEELLFNPGVDGLVVLPGGEPTLNSSEWMASPKFEQWLKQAVQRYPERLIILDAPPLLNVDDTLHLLPKVDAYLLVVGEGETSESEINQCLELTQDYERIGTVLNRSSDPQPDPY